MLLTSGQLPSFCSSRSADVLIPHATIAHHQVTREPVRSFEILFRSSMRMREYSLCIYLTWL